MYCLTIADDGGNAPLVISNLIKGGEGRLHLDRHKFSAELLDYLCVHNQCPYPIVLNLQMYNSDDEDPWYEFTKRIPPTQWHMINPTSKGITTVVELVYKDKK